MWYYNYAPGPNQSPVYHALTFLQPPFTSFYFSRIFIAPPCHLTTSKSFRSESRPGSATLTPFSSANDKKTQKSFQDYLIFNYIWRIQPPVESIYDFVFYCFFNKHTGDFESVLMEYIEWPVFYHHNPNTGRSVS